MPATVVKTKRDEKLWQHAKLMALRVRGVPSKKARGADSKAKSGKLTNDDAWGLVMSFFKKLKSGAIKMHAAEQVDAVLSGTAPKEVIESAYSRERTKSRPAHSTPSHLKPIAERVSNPVVRAFLDGDEYAFADSNDVEVLPEDHETLTTVNEMLSYLLTLDDGPDAPVLPDIAIADGFEGTVSDLYEIVSLEYDRCVQHDGT